MLGDRVVAEPDGHQCHDLALASGHLVEQARRPQVGSGWDASSAITRRANPAPPDDVLRRSASKWTLILSYNRIVLANILFPGSQPCSHGVPQRCCCGAPDRHAGKEKARSSGLSLSCAEEDSNLHPVIPDQALNLARLPIPPSARANAAEYSHALRA
jgi:hypothetical protein